MTNSLHLFFYDKENDTIAYIIDEPDKGLALILSEI